jgi:hypothetical protein
LPGQARQRKALKVVLILREWFCGRINLERQGDELWADFGVQFARVLKGVGNRASGGAT